MFSSSSNDSDCWDSWGFKFDFDDFCFGTSCEMVEFFFFVFPGRVMIQVDLVRFVDDDPETVDANITCGVVA